LESKSFTLVNWPSGSLDEGRVTLPGEEIVALETPIGKIGLTTCYDVRFPELYRKLREQEVDIALVPSAFTQITGAAHWDTLLRARAIENQIFIAASAQTGKHNEKRSSYGHSCIIDPWGTIIGSCGLQPSGSFCISKIDLSYLKKIRQDMPVWSHRRILN